MIKFSSKPNFDKDGTVLLLEKSQVSQNRFPGGLPDEVRDAIKHVADAGQFTGEKCQMFPLLHDGRTLVLLGLGEFRDLSMTKLRICVKTVMQSGFLRKINAIEVVPSRDSEEVTRAIVEGICLGTYRWDKYIASAQSETKALDKDITICANKRKANDNIVKVCGAVNFARDLVNENADVTTSDYLEKAIKKLIKGHKHVSMQVLNKKELKAKGLHLHLAVNQGSRREPKLVIVKYNGGSKKAKYTALVGKGLTYDTGGLNLKPTGHIESMKLDMGGAACVIGTLKSAIDLNLKRNVLFVCGIAENVTGAASYKPGEVLNSYSGKTVEVANTDAEGRLVLADAISYVVRNYKPGKIIDVATLTGACIVALGFDYCGLVSTDDSLAGKLIQSSKATDDRAWRLPMYPELSESVKSQIADIRNLGSPKGAGGAITAAEFLRQFTEDTTWAHLDIAGTSYVENGKRQYFGHGATGAGVRLLTHYLQHNS